MSATTDPLQQEEADRLFGMPKRFLEGPAFRYPGPGLHLAVPLTSLDDRERFSLDIGRSYVTLTKATYQTRARGNVVLARLDLEGAPHTNPDGATLSCPHLHIYREGYGDRWAYAVPDSIRLAMDDRKRTLAEFIRYCSIVEQPVVAWDLLA